MSLDITLKLRRKTVFEGNITHNLVKMAGYAGVYKACWHPEDLGFKKASDLISYLESGLTFLKMYPELFQKYNPANGWGNYDNLVSFLNHYLIACKNFPKARIYVSR